MEKFAVYTTIFGERDDLREPLCDNVEYIVFTDRPIESERARIIRMTSPYKDPARGSRFVRCHPHKFLAEYDVTLWLDASFVLKSVDGLLDYLGQHDLAISKHFSRDCIYEEAKVASRAGPRRSGDYRDKEGTEKKRRLPRRKRPCRHRGHSKEEFGACKAVQRALVERDRARFKTLSAFIQLCPLEARS